MSDRDTRPSQTNGVPESTSTSLLGKAKAGEAETWRRLVDQYAPLLYDWCRRRGLRTEDAADVAQEVFTAVARNLETFHRDQPGDTFRGWLWTITQNKIRDRIRDRKGMPEATGGSDAQCRLAQVPEPQSEPSTSVKVRTHGSPLEQRAIELVRAGVEERTWQAFWRVVVEGQQAAVVAKELGMSMQAVYNAKYRIRNRLQQQVDRLSEGLPPPGSAAAKKS